MKALIKQELRLSRKTLFIWMGIVLIMGIFCYCEYVSLKDSLVELTQMVDRFPQILRIMFGVTGDLSTVLGWYCCIYFWIAILVFSYAVYLGISSVAKEKAQGTSEYLFTKPLNRHQIIMAKVVANLCDLFILAAISGLCNYFTAVAPLGGLEQKNTVLLTTVGLFLTEVVLYAIGLMISGLTKSYKSASMLGAGTLIAFYCIYVAAECLKNPVLPYLTPIKYYDVCVVAIEGISITFLLISGLITFISVFIAKRQWAGKEL